MDFLPLSLTNGQEPIFATKVEENLFSERAFKGLFVLSYFRHQNRMQSHLL